MGRTILLTAACGMALLLTGCGQRVQLFNGENLDGWAAYLPPDADVTADEVWEIRDGVLYCAGKPNGYIRTTNTYDNYKLHLEWRWPENPTNSGVLLHAQPPDQVWPECIEAQLKSGSAGDFVLIRNTALTVDDRRYHDAEKMYVVIPKANESNEVQAGEWNEYDILCDDGEITLWVNGVKQNEGEQASVKSGWICLQSEGSPIEFRNIYLRKL